MPRPANPPGLVPRVPSLHSRIGLDSRNLSLPQGTGVATYAAMLARCLPLIGRQPEILLPDPPLARPLRWLAAALPSPARSRLHANPTGWPTRTAPDLFRIAQVHFDLYGRLRPLTGPSPPSLMHWTYPIPLRFAGIRNLYTIHDIIPLLHPTLTGIDPIRARRILSRIAAGADHLVTVSEASRQDLINQLGIDPADITNTWQAVDVTMADPASPNAIPGAYYLHVGAIERRKNLPRLIAAWRASGTPCPLILAGPDGWAAAETLAAAAPFLGQTSQPGRPTILRLPYLPRPQLLALIRGARALLMPSLAEGFGLPVAEAMALGTPVVTSATGALAEIAADAALLVDPLDPAAIAAALQALDASPDLRARLAAAGETRAKLFTVEAYAARLRTLYDPGTRGAHESARQ